MESEKFFFLWNTVDGMEGWKSMSRICKSVSVLLAAAMIFTGAAGCKSGGSEIKVAENSEAVTFPLKKQITFTVWRPAVSGLLAKYPDQGNLPYYKELTKRTGVKFIVKCPPVGQEKDQFNLMISSGDLPDIFDGMSVPWYYPGSINKAYADGIIIKLNDLQKKYAPELMEIYRKYPGVDAFVKNDSGDYLSVPYIRGNSELCTTGGLIIRKDWLDRLSMEVPKTIRQWHDVLSAFKNQIGATAPMLDMKANALTGAYGIATGYFLEDGKVKFGPADARYKDFLTEMAEWYKEGLIDPEIATNNSKTRDAKACSEKTGAFVAAGGSGLGRYMQTMAPVNPNYELVGVQNAVLKNGDINRFYNTETAVDAPDCSISSQCGSPDIAMRLLNYGFTREGYIFNNFGIEGTSFHWVDNYPKYTDTITKNPDGLSMTAALQLYARSAENGPFVQDPRYRDQYFALPEQKQAVKSWRVYSEHAQGPDFPYLRGVLSLTESGEITPVETQVNTYVEEMLYKFVEGQAAITDDSFKAYVAQLKTLGLDTAVKDRQTAEDRFKKANPTLYTSETEINVSDMYQDVGK